MKENLIGIDNKRFEAEIVRYFKNVNDRYLIYSKSEKDGNYTLLYATKVVSDNGIKVGRNITDPNEWALVTNFLQRTAKENKEGTPVSIEDCNPVDLIDLKIEAQRVFKIKNEDVEILGQNKKSFEIIQRKLDAEKLAVNPVAPETMEYATKDDNKVTNFFDKMPAFNGFNVNTPVTSEPVVAKEEPVLEPIKEETPTAVEEDSDYETLYISLLSENKELLKELTDLTNENSDLRKKLDTIKELVS